MITELFQKQVANELDLIYKNLYSFVKNFYGSEAADSIDAFDYIIFIAPNFLYVQQHWTDENGYPCVLEADIDYKEYNEWFNGLDL